MWSYRPADTNRRTIRQTELMGCVQCQVAKVTFLERDSLGSISETIRYVPTDSADGFFGADLPSGNIHLCDRMTECEYV